MGFENTLMSFVRTKKLLNKLSKEKRELLEEEVLSINDILADEVFTDEEKLEVFKRKI